VNAALIAGNPPERRVEELREFWEAVSTPPLGVRHLASIDIKDDVIHRVINQTRALGIMLRHKASRHLGLTASHRLAHLEPLELRVIQIQRLVIPCPTMCGAECFRFGPRFEDGTVFPHRVRSIKRVILSLGAFEKVKLYKAGHLVEMTVARHPNVLESCFGALGNPEAVHRDKHSWVS
jgi:hypothetical protein